jgi:Dimethlysulfonioproprionate lyase
MIETNVARFRDAFAGVLRTALPRDPALSSFLNGLGRLDASAARPHAETPMTHPALRHLPRAIERLQGDAALLQAVRDVVPLLRWTSSYATSGPAQEAAQRMVWGEVAGKFGLVRTADLRLGCFLVSPGMHYPLHGHEALEIYYSVSGAMSVEHGFDGARHDVGAPGYSITPSGEAHALHVGPEPLLLVYCWTGDLESPVWWWERTDGADWRKYFPPLQRS